MSSLQEVLSDYQHYKQACADLFGDWQPADACAVKLERHRETLDSSALLDALQQIGPVQGWLLLTGERVILKNEPIDDLSQHLLAADLYANGVSFRVRELTDGKWLLVRLQLMKCNVIEATHLAVTVNHLATEKGIKELSYQQLWCKKEGSGLQIDDAVFSGFEGA